VTVIAILLLVISAVPVIAAPLAGWAAGQLGLRWVFWSVIAGWLIHTAAAAFVFEDPEAGIFMGMIAALLCVAGLLSVLCSALFLRWMGRRAVKGNLGELNQ
jgi:hypothetical protein